MNENQRAEWCVQALQGIDDNDLDECLKFADEWERLAKLRDLIQRQLMRALTKVSKAAELRTGE